MVGSGIGSDIPRVDIVVFDKMSRKAGLTEMNRYFVVVTRPLEMCAQEPIDSSQKVDGGEAGEKLFEPSFNCGVFREINKVIDVEPDGKGCSRDILGGIVGVAYAACAHTWVRGVGFEANALENRRDLVVLVAGTSAETIQCFLEEPIFVLGGIRVADRRLYDSDLVVGEDALTKGVLAVALLEDAALFDGETDQ